jgi:hypothetical protein
MKSGLTLFIVCSTLALLVEELKGIDRRNCAFVLDISG